MQRPIVPNLDHHRLAHYFSSMRKSLAVLAVLISAATVLLLNGCAPLRDQNGHPVLDKKGNEEYHKTL